MFNFILVLFVLVQCYCFSAEKVQYFDTHMKTQEDFNILTTHQDIEDLTIRVLWHRSYFNFSSLKNLSNLKRLNFRGDSGGISTDAVILETVPAIPSLKHLGIRGFSFSKEAFDKLPSWLALNPQLESLDLTDKHALAPFTELKHLKKLNLSDTYIGITDSHFNLSILHDFPSLTSLDVRKNSFLQRPEDLLLILNLPLLEELYIGGRTAAPPDNLFLSARLFERNFHTLTTSNTLKTLVFENVITDSVDFSHLAPNLETLGLINVTGSMDFRKLQNNHKLESLQLSDITWDAPSLEQINLVSLGLVKKFTSNSAKGINIPHLMPNVEELYLASSNITGGELKKIGQLTSVTVLDLSHTALNGTSLTHLKNLTNLKKLSLNGLNLSTGDFKHLKNLPALEELSLSESTLALSQLDSLREMTNLKYLNLSKINNPNITSTEIHALQQKLLHTQVISEFLNNS